MRQLWTQAAVVALTAGTLSACATDAPQYPAREGQAPAPARSMPTPNFPITQAPAQPQAAAPSAANETDAAETLPPPQAITTQPIPTQTQPTVTRSDLPPPPAPTPAPQPVLRPVPSKTVVTTTVTGPVVEVAGKPQVHVVKSGDTLTSIAKSFGVNVNDLAKDNDIKKGQTLRLGQKVTGPASEQKAYVVQTGDTIFAIAKRFNVSAAALADENDLKTGSAIKKGQKLVLPDGYKDRGPIKTTTTVTRPAPTPSAPSNTYARVETPTPSRPAPTPSSPVPYTPSGNTYSRPSAPVSAQPVTPPPSSTRPIIESSAAPTEAEIVASGKGKFTWPVRGEIALGFGANGPGQRNDGLDIRAPQGTPVVSAADGKVAYAGNQVLGFGNLVLVRHADGWVTAYARLSSINVKMQQDVKQGEQLGAVGATGGATEPALHFEMRYAPTVKDKAKPVNPSLVLPSR